MANQNPTLNPSVFNPSPLALDPGVIKFVVAVVIASLVVEALSRVSEGAAWVLVFIILLGVFLNNPLLIGFISSGSNFLQGAIS